MSKDGLEFLIMAKNKKGSVFTAFLITNKSPFLTIEGKKSIFFSNNHDVKIYVILIGSMFLTQV